MSAFASLINSERQLTIEAAERLRRLPTPDRASTLAVDAALLLLRENGLLEEDHL